MRTALSLDAGRSGSDLRELRQTVRSFLNAELDRGAFVPTVDSWLTGWSVEFSKSLASRGWLGMTIPKEYGGHGMSFLERFVVTEELLSFGAPVAAHWVADRQAAPTILRFGTFEQKQRLLPAIARAEAFFAIGMSEPDSGSDLASVRTRARRVDGGWSVTGTKVWTSGAHAADLVVVLVRTSGQHGDRHSGLSQLIVDLRSPGVDIRPITSMTGEHHFNEVVLDSVLVPDGDVLGQEGDGWAQVTSELGFERSGPERFLSVAPLVSEVLQAIKQDLVESTPEIGRMLARFHALHQMSFAVALALEGHQEADTAAAAVKMLGTMTEGDFVESVDLLTAPVRDGRPLGALVDAAVAQRPGFTLRGGTNEVLRGVVARGLGLR
ncbi:acyl-CoA dehydrogenase family protein [Aeromicrobium sp. CTD01-1L150]|uniref:acyl-CoA dehydrogenase family protein n=1 Tax=Aeromicrobium sp. CTD01-1L150 TaxID=3341830 RepID=UPI0035BF5F0C